jgi:hypothetical protein
MRFLKPFLALIVLGALAVGPAEATIISFSPGLSSFGTAASIIPPPPAVLNPFVVNTAQQGFNEQQGVLLLAPLAVDGGNIAAGTLVDSHMIFLNQDDALTGTLSHLVTWTFSGVILGVMSDVNGTLEAASTPILGAFGTTYPLGFGNRGLESNDSYLVAGNQITLNLHVSQPGDWVRVVTASPIPEPGTLFLIGSGLAGLALRRRRRS